MSVSTNKLTDFRVSREEMIANEVQLVNRDACAHLLIPLNKCRRQTGSEFINS